MFADTSFRTQDVFRRVAQDMPSLETASRRQPSSKDVSLVSDFFCHTHRSPLGLGCPMIFACLKLVSNFTAQALLGYILAHPFTSEVSPFLKTCPLLKAYPQPPRFTLLLGSIPYSRIYLSPFRSISKPRSVPLLSDSPLPTLSVLHFRCYLAYGVQLPKAS